jgi:predicted Zn-dependent protease
MMLSTPAMAQSRLPTLGEGGDMTIVGERKLGDRIAREIYRDPDYIDDPVLAEYVQGIWQPLLAAARGRGELTPEMEERFAWDIFLGRDRTVNAFALPGGYLGLHLGLIAVVANRDELAAVLAHELSHVTQRHISRLTAKQSQQAPWLIGAMILGALAASKSPDAANAVIAGSQAVSASAQLGFSRDMEREADRIGYGVMTQAGFAPQGFVTMFDKLQQASRLSDNGSFPYLRSHPLTSERMGDMQSRQQLLTRPATADGPSMEHALVTARARVLSRPGADVLRGWAAEPAAPPFGTLAPARKAGVLYAAALASVELRDVSAARSLHGQLLPLVAGNAPSARLAKLLGAEIELAAGDAARAAAAIDADSAGRPELLLLAQARVRTGQPAPLADMAERLQAWVATRPRDAGAWQALASVYQARGQGLRGVRAEAEAQVAVMDYAAAVDRFKAAQDMTRRGGGGAVPGDHIEASIIDTRLRQVESLLREQALER